LQAAASAHSSTVDPCVGLRDKVEELAVSLDKFKPATDSWECPGCMCRNDGDKTKCPSCEAVKPGSEPAAAPEKSSSLSGFSFSSFAPAAAATTVASSIFSGLGGKVEELKVVVTSDPDELSFENLGLKLNNAADAAQVAAKIKNTKIVKTLTFSGNTVGIEAAEVIGKALEGHPEFERAHWKDMFTGRMKTEIPPALKHLSNGIMTAQAHLVELDLSDNAFGPIGAEGIVDLLKSSSCFTLKELRLNNTGCGVTGGKLLAKTLLESYHNSGKKLALKVFVLGRSRQENDGAIELAKVFKLMGSLEEVVMPQNGIYHVGIAALSDAFSNNPNLRILNMNDNTFTDLGAAALAKALPSMPNLQVLNLGDCLLKTKGAQLIADALKSGHTELEELYLDANEIRYDGGESIIAAIANKSKLKILKIDGNQFGSDGCGKLMKQLKDSGKRHVLEEIEDDEEPDDDEDEDENQTNGDHDVDKARIASVSNGFD
jgi:Ran GTPase-activating protein 1